MPEKPAQTCSPADAGNFAQQRTRIRRHVINPGYAAHDFGILQLGNAAAGPLDDFFQAIVGGALRKVVRIGAALAVEISNQKFVLPVGAKVGGADRVDAGATAALHVGSVFQDRDLVILGLNRQFDSDALKQRPGPGSGGRDHDRRRNLAVIGADSAHASTFDAEAPEPGSSTGR